MALEERKSKRFKEELPIVERISYDDTRETKKRFFDGLDREERVTVIT